MMKIGKFFTLILMLCLVAIITLSFASCDKISDLFGKDDVVDEPTENVWNINTVYEQAKTLGYEGSLEEFLTLVSGKDGANGKDGINGTSITSSFIDEKGHLILVLSNGTTIDAGKLPSAESSGVFKVTFDLGNGQKNVSYSKNFRIEKPENPTRENYRFLYWYIEIDGFSQITPWLFDAYAVTSDITLYARWVEIGNSQPPVVEPPPQIGTGGDDDDEWWENIKYDETNLLFKMTKCDNSEELSSGCAQYLAGEYDDTNREDPINILINERNQNAYELTKVNVTYDYFDDTQELYGFSNARNAIYREIMANTSATPDMYCNWMTDLLICSLQGCFANLYSRQYGEGDFQANNHFNLKNDGYMADLMGTLTLSTQKIYVVASDYFIDIIRSFYVIPVNVSLFNRIAPSMYPAVANPDINTFFDEVKPCDCTNYDTATRCTDECADGGWTYDRLIQFSQKIYQSNGTSGTETIHDRLGFALGANGLPAAGLIYTSSVTIINKEWDADNNKYNYSYPATNEKLYALFDKISDMMDTKGVYFATAADAAQLNYEGEKTALLGIRNQFVSDKMLFGGIVTLGSLEYEAYQNMKTPTRGGFGVVPVPVYEQGDKYLTAIHATAKGGAIRYNTEKFVQCSAFLHYQSSNSKEIVDDYYEYTLVHGAAGGPICVEGNIEMLQYIRQNVRTSFDKLFEDAIGFMYESVIEDSAKNRFHTLLADNGYQYDVSDKYEELYSIKSQALQNLEYDYDKLPR